MTQYKIIKDTREKSGWEFQVNEYCQGVINRKLDTGDYTLVGYENSFVIERKKSVSELAGNIFDKRFLAELERLKDFRYAYIICEFDLTDIVGFPHNTGLRPSVIRKIRVTPQILLKKILEFELKYGVKFHFVGKYGKSFVSSLFKRVLECLSKD